MEYPKFKVCCRCFTFNHSKYITDAMNGFTMQQTSFPFICTIVDDASTDGEQDVICKYVEENFDFSEGSVAYHKETDYAHITYAQHKNNRNCYFAVLYLKENHYSQKKSKMGYLSEWRDMCEYEALCEGDDYWIVPDKLEKQVDFLDNNNDYGMCYTRCNYYNQNKAQFERIGWGGPSVTFEDLVKECTVPTLTVMLRGAVIRQYEKEGHTQKKGWLMGDYPLWLWLSHESKIHFMKDITSIYRVLDNSASHSNRYDVYEKFMYSTFDMLLYFCNLYNRQSLLSQDKLYSILFNAAVLYGNFEKEKEYYRKIKKKNLKQKIKHVVCYNRFIYSLLAPYLFYTK